jgi:hypothetical protein
VSSTSAYRFPFLLAAALVAGAVGDVVVEGVSNTGTFGSGYFDHDHLSVIPVLVAGLALVLEVAVLRLMALLRGTASQARPDRLIDVAARFSTGSPLRDLPLVFGLQLAAVFAMQNAEQLAASGMPVGGLGWLGGPLVFALLVYAATAAACTVVLGFLARAILVAGTALIRIVLELVLALVDRDVRAWLGRLTDVPCVRAQAPHVRQIGGRAPPRFPTPA